MSQGYASAGIPLDPKSQIWVPTYTNFTLGGGTVVANYLEDGDLITAELQILFASDTSIDADDPTFSMPVTARTGYLSSYPLGPMEIEDQGIGFFGGVVVPTSTTKFLCRVYKTDTTHGQLVPLTSAVPMTWAINDRLGFTARYFKAP